ncbi:MAG: histidine kinase dimerization/phosphoacceptor domain -containing protein [Imperialibacter sp.]|uniref:histidine kinase dimerization/phosphoacceptor domain -containing protein n=1 Tax=Imperialibacter sp. TaxID=2038411 RepID=UPI0032EA9F5C
MNLFRKLCWWGITFCCWSPANAQDYSINKTILSVEDGLLDRNMQDTYVDSRGFTWFGMTTGLTRYDGHNMASFTMEEGHLLYSSVGEINEDIHGNLWLLHSVPPNHKVINLGVFNPLTNKSISLSEYLGRPLPFQMEHLTWASGGTEAGDILLFTSDNAVFLYDGDSLHTEPICVLDHGITNGYIRDEHVWVYGQTTVTKINKAGQKLKTLYRVDSRLLVGIDSDGRMISARNTADSLESYLVYADDQPIDFMPNENYLDYRVFGVDLYNRRIWIERKSTQMIYVYTFDGQLLAKKQQAGEILDPYFPSPWMDRFGNYWMKQSGKIFRFTLLESKFRTFLTDAETYGTQGYNARGMQVIRDTLYVNGLGNTYAIDLKTGSKTSIISGTPYYYKVPAKGEPDLYNEDKRHAFWLDQDGKLWFTDEGHRVSWFKPTDERTKDYYYTSETNLRAEYPRLHWSIIRDKHGKLWIGHAQGISFMNSQDSLQVFKDYNEFPLLEKSTVYHFHERGDSLWLATSTGVYLLDQQKGIIDRYHSEGPDGRIIPHDHIAHINEFEPGILWLASKGGGIISLDIGDNSYKQYTTKNGLTHNETYGIYRDDYGYLWVSSAKGIMQINAQNFSINSYFESDGLAHDECNTISHYQAEDGRLFFGGINGVNVFDPKDFLTDVAPAKIYVTSFNMQSSSDGSFRESIEGFIRDKNTIHVYPSDLAFQVGYSIIDYKSEKIQYAYKIENFDQQWTYTDRPEISIRSLPYGNYTLVLTGRGTAHRTAEELRIPIIIHKPFYLETWFFILTTVLCVVAVGLFVRIREHNLQQGKKVLENLIEERTHQLRHEKAEVLKQLHEKETLRQEVHHRVKNNLTFLKSLLYLRSKSADSKEVKVILDECQARIETMALVHQNLYDVDNITEVDFGTFTEELFLELKTLFDIRDNVTINVESDDIRLDMKLSVFLGLILNELITNSFKYAFTNSKSGSISVKINQSENSIGVAYGDSGSGLQDGFDTRTSPGFGFRIINILVSQIDATMTYEARTFQLTIPK